MNVTGENIDSNNIDTNDTDLALKKQLELVDGISRTMSSLLIGLADASKGFKDNMQEGGSSVTEVNGISNGAIQTANNISKTLTNATLDLINQFMPVIEKSITGEYAKMSSEDATKNINDVLTRQKKLFIDLSQNEELQKSLQDWIKAYAEIGIQAIRITKPSLDEIVEEFWNSINKVLVKSTRAVINIGINVGKSAVATIPVAGGGLVLFISFIQGINEGMLASAPVVKASTKIALKTKTTGEKLINETQDKITEANKKYKELEQIMKTPIEGVSKDIQSKAIADVGDAGRKLGQQTIQNIKPNVPVVKPNVSASGGSCITCIPSLQNGGKVNLTRKNINKQITNVTRRITRSLKLFNKSNKKNNKKIIKKLTIKKKRNM